LELAESPLIEIISGILELDIEKEKGKNIRKNNIETK